MTHRKILFLLLTLFSVAISAQNMTYNFEQTTSPTARTRNIVDDNGNVCAAVVVRIPRGDAKFESALLKNVSPFKDGEYILDMCKGAARLQVYVPGYNKLEVSFREKLDGTLESKVTYMLTISLPQLSAEKKKEQLSIKVTPSKAIVVIDGDLVNTSTQELAIGTHAYNVVADGYYPQSGTREIREGMPSKLIVELEKKEKTNQPTPSPVQYEASDTPVPVTFTVKGVSFTMIPVEGGTFTMGATSEQKKTESDEKPAHQVTLSSYMIGETEVTQALWQTVMGSNPSRFTGDSQRPVENVSWNDCQSFINKLNSLTGKRFSLPTEAQWEYAARGGKMNRGYQYSGSSSLDDVAWYDKNSYDKGASSPDYGTHRIKTKKANELGIYDMSGNVWEWCSDWKDNYSSSAQTNPTGPTSGSSRVYRGGCWYFNARFCRSAYRGNYTPDFSGFGNLGLRLCLSE